MRKLPALLRLCASLITYPARRIAWRIIAPYALLTFAFAATGTYITTSIVTGSLRERFEKQLVESAQVAADAFVRQERRHLENVRAVAFTDGVPRALQARDEAALARFILPIAANGQVERVEVVDRQGLRLYGAVRLSGEGAAYTPLAEPTDRAGWSIVQQALSGRHDDRGDKFSALAQTSSGYVLFTSAPIYDGDLLVGAVLVGTEVESFLTAVKLEALADVTLYIDAVPVATTFSQSGDAGESDLTLRTPLFDRDAGTGAVREQRQLYGRDFVFLYTDLLIRGERAGSLSVAMPAGFISGAGSITRGRMALFFAAGTMVVFATGWLIARSLTEPLHHLLGTAKAVAGGDLTARSAIHQSDEIGVLAVAFDAMTSRLQHQHIATVRALTSAIDARDPYTLGHSVRVALLAVELGRKLGLPPDRLQHLEIGGYLHDIGKIGIRDAVLLKPGALSPEERRLIEEHPLIGLRILEPVELAPEVIEFVSGHHERLNGGGYPRGLKEGDISIIPRIAAIADMYDAMTTDRPYRGAMTPVQALALMGRESESGILDTAVLAAMREIFGRWEERRRDDPALRGFPVLSNLAGVA